MRYVIARGVAGVLGMIRRMGVMGGMGVFAGEAPGYHGESGWRGVSLGGGGRAFSQARRLRTMVNRAGRRG